VKEINDPTFNQYVRANDNFLMGDINLGIIIAGQNFHLGFSSRHLIQDRVKLGNTPDFAKLHETYTGFARAKFFVKDNVEMVPSIDGIYTRGIPFHVKINAPFVFHEMFLAGLAFSPLKSFSVETGVYSSGLFFGYAFTLNTSELVSFSDLTHELAIRYVLPITNNAQYKFSITDALF
ncbi:MAG: type IX secretion system membrane protein PorP/SprF, partial [Bacteroidales bacterium]